MNDPMPPSGRSVDQLNAGVNPTAYRTRTNRPGERYGERTTGHGVISLIMSGTVMALGKVAAGDGKTRWWRVDWRAAEAPTSSDSISRVCGRVVRRHRGLLRQQPSRCKRPAEQLCNPLTTLQRATAAERDRGQNSTDGFCERTGSGENFPSPAVPVQNQQASNYVTTAFALDAAARLSAP